MSTRGWLVIRATSFPAFVSQPSLITFDRFPREGHDHGAAMLDQVLKDFARVGRAIFFLRGASLTVKPTASRDMSTWWEQQQQLEQEQKRAGAYTGVDNYSAIASSTVSYTHLTLPTTPYV